jgi:perosamine synthetase
MIDSSLKQGRRTSMLPYGRQWIDEDDIEAVVAVLRSDYLTTGPAVERFERKLALKVGARYAVAFANGTAALHAACYAAGIGAGDEVITTPLTFAASANCVLYQGGTPVFADVDERTYNLDPEAARRLITPRTKAIIPVDYTGQPAKLDAFRALAEEYGLVLIEDAAHALGAQFQAKPVGSISDMTMFSLHPVKPITAGEGGVITTNDERYCERLLHFRNHGIVRDPARYRTQPPPGRWYYEMQSLGFNYRMTDFQAALAASQTDKLDTFVKRRKEIAELYNEAFAGRGELIVPHQAPDASSSWHLYVLQLNLERLTRDRNWIMNRLLEENIGVNLHYIPVYLHPYYRELGYEPGLCPAAERLYGRILTLPLFPAMTPQDVDDVIRAVHRVIGEAAR